MQKMTRKCMQMPATALCDLTVTIIYGTHPHMGAHVTSKAQAAAGNALLDYKLISHAPACPGASKTH